MKQYFPFYVKQAKNQAISGKKWLLINVQNVEEFSCQALNRDVWNHQMVRDLVAENFVFWQVAKILNF